MPDHDDSERFQDKPRARPGRDENIQPARPRGGPAREDDDEPDNDEPDDRPRRRRRGPDVRRDDDAVSTIIPYRNGMALAGYYCGVFSLIPLLGAILGPLAVIFGITGLRHVSRNPEAKGTGHAVTAIILGSIGGLYNWALVVLFFVGIVGRHG